VGARKKKLCFQLTSTKPTQALRADIHRGSAMWNLKFIKFKPWFAIEEAAWPVLRGGGESRSEEEKVVFKRCNNIDLLKGDRVFTISPFELESLERGRGGARGGRRWGEVEALDTTRRNYNCRWLSVHLITHVALVLTAHVCPSYLLTLTGILLNIYLNPIP
jgi:hypothetical protein